MTESANANKSPQRGRDKITLSEALGAYKCSLQDLLYQACMGEISFFVSANPFPNLWTVSSIIGYPDVPSSIRENFGSEDDPVFAHLAASSQQHPKSISNLVSSITSIESGAVQSVEGEFELDGVSILTRAHRLASLYDHEITGIVPVATATILNAITNPNDLGRCIVMIRLSNTEEETGFGELAAIVAPAINLQDAIASNRIYVSKSEVARIRKQIGRDLFTTTPRSQAKSDPSAPKRKWTRIRNERLQLEADSIWASRPYLSKNDVAGIIMDRREKSEKNPRKVLSVEYMEKILKSPRSRKKPDK